MSTNSTSPVGIATDTQCYITYCKLDTEQSSSGHVVGLLRARDIDQKQPHSSNGATANAGSVMLTAEGRG